MQEIDCGTLYEAEPGLFLPPGDRRVLAEVAGRRALVFGYDALRRWQGKSAG